MSVRDGFNLINLNYDEANEAGQAGRQTGKGGKYIANEPGKLAAWQTGRLASRQTDWQA